MKAAVRYTFHVWPNLDGGGGWWYQVRDTQLGKTVYEVWSIGTRAAAVDEATRKCDNLERGCVPLEVA